MYAYALGHSLGSRGCRQGSAVPRTSVALLLLLTSLLLLQLVTGGDGNSPAKNDIYGISKISGQPITKWTAIGDHDEDDTKPTSLSSSTTPLLKCPKLCVCISLTVDCSNKGLVSVPRNIPANVERL